MRRLFEKTIRSELYPEQVGDYELIALVLESPKLADGFYKQISLDLIYTNISIFEDINSNCLSATLTLVDGEYLVTDFPIIGEDKSEPNDDFRNQLVENARAAILTRGLAETAKLVVGLGGNI